MNDVVFNPSLHILFVCNILRSCYVHLKSMDTSAVLFFVLFSFSQLCIRYQCSIRRQGKNSVRKKEEWSHLRFELTYWVWRVFIKCIPYSQCMLYQFNSLRGKKPTSGTFNLNEMMNSCARVTQTHRHKHTWQKDQAHVYTC